MIGHWHSLSIIFVGAIHLEIDSHLVTRLDPLSILKFNPWYYTSLHGPQKFGREGFTEIGHCSSMQRWPIHGTILKGMWVCIGFMSNV